MKIEYIDKKTIRPNRSLRKNKGKNKIWSELESLRIGLLDPTRCKKKRCKKTKPTSIKGKVKCKLKKRLSVALSIANPPQTQ